MYKTDGSGEVPFGLVTHRPVTGQALCSVTNCWPEFRLICHMELDINLATVVTFEASLSNFSALMCFHENGSAVCGGMQHYQGSICRKFAEVFTA